jgi:hypothetical protein
MADERRGPSIERVREQLRRNDPPEPAHDPDDAPDLDRVTEVRKRLEPDDQPPE